jgi:hypothetical protein
MKPVLYFHPASNNMSVNIKIHATVHQKISEDLHQQKLGKPTNICMNSRTMFDQDELRLLAGRFEGFMTMRFQV